jgi:aminopeptidase N
LDEAFATYSERIFYEQYYPEHLDWYWDSYIISHNPYGNIDITIYYGGNLFEYRDIVYRNGALFLHDLRNALGDEAFFIFLRDYVNTYRYEIATSTDFFSLLKKYTDADLSPIINAYFSEPPELP